MHFLAHKIKISTRTKVFVEKTEIEISVMTENLQKMSDFRRKRNFQKTFFGEVHCIQLYLKGDLGENKATSTTSKSDEVFISNQERIIIEML